MFYDRPYKVKKWVVVLGELNEKQQEALKKAMPKKSTLVVPWFSLEMPAELKKLAVEGYWEQINLPMPYFLDMTLALRAVVNLTRKHNPVAQISSRPAYHRICSNRIENESDYVKLCNDVLRANDDITLSQVFDLARHEGGIFVSNNADIEIVRRLSEEIVTLGNDASCDINVSDLTGKELASVLSPIFRD